MAYRFILADPSGLCEGDTLSFDEAGKLRKALLGDPGPRIVYSAAYRVGDSQIELPEQISWQLAPTATNPFGI